MATQPTPSLEPEVASRYPTVEHFVGQASKESLPGTFAAVREGLSAVKGPRVEHAKKAQVALDRAEELFGQLIDVRERLVEEQGLSKRRR